jgi:N12 class adenine-specific DNA methylase
MAATPTNMPRPFIAVLLQARKNGTRFSRTGRHRGTPGHGVTFATGTPISNTMVEMYTMQRFLDPDGLRSRGLEHFDAWAATFGEVIDTMEISPDGAGLRPRSRFARFTNLPELQQMFRAFSDVQTAEMLDLPRPRLEGDKPIIVACPMSDEQHEAAASDRRLGSRPSQLGQWPSHSLRGL